MSRIEVSLAKQTLKLFDDAGRLLREYTVSTSKNGAGEQCDSDCTPRGRHIIRAKIGAGLPLKSVFVGRRPTGEVYTSELGESHPGRDWILTRILWLSGCEPGFNRMHQVDTMRRYVYIHGTSDEQGIGQPVSHGCIRMRNRDVVELFDQVAPGTPVEIVET
ncbi:MAG: L,D-transpeptidase [Burkholderiales bacterium]|nr:L,D-transpeptidase [Burkholderiales bacterium]